MKMVPAGVGATPKKTAILVGLVVVGLPLVYWLNRPDTPPAQATSASATLPPRPAVIPALRKNTDQPSLIPARRGAASRDTGRVDEFHPTMKTPENLDISKIDPTLHLDLLAKVRETPVEGGSRSLFDFYTPPPPPPPKVDPIKPAPPPTQIAEKSAEPPKPPAPPPPPPIPLKYYGYAGTAANGGLRACFLDGDPATGEIFVAGENETVKNRYKIIRIGVKSAVVEDTSNKNQQTLPLVTEEGG